LKALFSTYRQFIIRFTEVEIHLFHHKDGSWKQKTKKTATPFAVCYDHNRKKELLIQEGEPLLFLVKLGIQKQDGQIVKGQRDKFIQINRFLESVQHTLKSLSKEKFLLIYDLGCGKAYLTFALYYLLLENSFTNFKIIGVDRKADVMNFCTSLARSLGWNNLYFEEGNIETVKPAAQVGMVIALHACNTATDDALYQAIVWQAEAVFVAPCCQHEVLHDMKASNIPALLSHGLIRERIAALATDAMRARLLELVGYKVDCIEFVDLEHTPKNLLIRAQKNQKVCDQKKFQEYEELKQLFSAEPKLGKLLAPIFHKF